MCFRGDLFHSTFSKRASGELGIEINAVHYPAYSKQTHNEPRDTSLIVLGVVGLVV